MMTLHPKYLALMNAASSADSSQKLLRACFCLLSLSRAIDADCALRLNKYKLSEGKFVLLFFLAQHPEGIAPTELAKMAGVTKATVTGLSNGLVNAGLIKRILTTSDRRSFKLALSAKGKQITQQLTREHGVWICSLFERLKTADLEKLETFLSLIWLRTDEGKKASSTLTKPSSKRSLRPRLRRTKE